MVPGGFQFGGKRQWCCFHWETLPSLVVDGQSHHLHGVGVMADRCLSMTTRNVGLQGKLGGGEGIEGLYGSITRSGMQKILDSLVENCQLNNNSHVVDVGAGLGR